MMDFSTFLGLYGFFEVALIIVAFVFSIEKNVTVLEFLAIISIGSPIILVILTFGWVAPVLCFKLSVWLHHIIGV